MAGAAADCAGIRRRRSGPERDFIHDVRLRVEQWFGMEIRHVPQMATAPLPIQAEKVRQGVFKRIEMFYNPHRRCASLGYLGSAAYERRWERGELAPKDQVAWNLRTGCPFFVGRATA